MIGGSEAAGRSAGRPEASARYRRAAGQPAKSRRAIPRTRGWATDLPCWV